MGLLKKLINAYKEDKKQSQEFLARVEAQKAREATSNAREAALATAPKKYSPPFMFLGAPTKIGDMTQAYRYGVVLADIDPDVLKAGFEAETYNFEFETVDNLIYATLAGRRAGVITEYADMILDWISRNAPIRLYLNTYTENDACKLILVFYKDKSASHKWREQSVVPLTSYKGRAKQEISAFLVSKEEVEIGEEYTGDKDDIIVCYKGEMIGKLPSKIKSRVLEASYSYAEIDDVIKDEDDNGNEIYQPVIRIYW